MTKKDSVRFFLRFLLLTIITIFLVVFSLLLVSAGGFGAIIGVVLVVINVFFLLSFLVMAFVKLIKHLFDKERDYFDFMYIVNILFVLLINGVFMIFYFTLIVGAMVILLPLLA
jgi:hypothetical protein